MDIFIREHKYDDKSCPEGHGLYSRCIYCGETIGQGWYGTENSKCDERINHDKINEWLNFRNMTIYDINAVGEELFAIKRYSNNYITYNDFLRSNNKPISIVKNELSEKLYDFIREQNVLETFFYRNKYLPIFRQNKRSNYIWIYKSEKLDKVIKKFYSVVEVVEWIKNN